MSKKTLATLFENKSINEFKTKSLIVILGMCEDLEAQECLNYILERKESKELSQFGIMLLMQGLEKKWSPEVLKSFMKYAENVGLAFQIVDDILDYQEGNREENSFLSYMTLEEAKRYADNLTNEGILAIESYDDGTLTDLALYLTTRKF